MQKKSMVKLSLLTLIVAFMAFGTIAIAKTVITNETPANKTVTTEPWYFQGGDPEVAENYAREEVEDKQCGTLAQTICQILATEDGSTGHPNLAEPVGGETHLDQIKEAMNSLGSVPAPNETVQSFRTL